MNIVHLAEKYELNDLELQIVGYIDKNLKNLKSIGIRQMAKDNYTSTSAIYKLCHKFGFDSYSDMIFSLTNTSENKLDMSSLFEQYHDSFSSLLLKDKRVVVFGLGFSSPIAEYIHQRLTLLGYQSMCVVHMEMLGQWNMENTVFIVVSYSGMTPRLSEIVDTAYKNNVPIISFVGNKESDMYKQSTLPILIGRYDMFNHDLNRANTFYGETIIAFETLLFM